MRRTRGRPVGLLCLACALVVACGDGARGACALLARGDAERVLGGPVSDPPLIDAQVEAEHSDRVSTCTYSMERGNPHRSVTLVLARLSNSETTAPDPWDTYVADFRKRFGALFPLELIDDIGEGAAWLPNSKQLTVYAHGALLTFVIAGAVDVDLEAVKAMAREAVARMP